MYNHSKLTRSVHVCEGPPGWVLCAQNVSVTRRDTASALGCLPLMGHRQWACRAPGVAKERHRIPSAISYQTERSVRGVAFKQRASHDVSLLHCFCFLGPSVGGLLPGVSANAALRHAALRDMCRRNSEDPSPALTCSDTDGSSGVGEALPWGRRQRGHFHPPPAFLSCSPSQRGPSLERPQERTFRGESPLTVRLGGRRGHRAAQAECPATLVDAASPCWWETSIFLHKKAFKAAF